MESFAAFPDGEWDYSFNRMFSNEELELAQQILHQFSFPGQEDDGEGFSVLNPSAFCPIPEANMSIAEMNESLLFSSNALDSNFHYNSQESSQSSNSSDSVVFASPPVHEAYYLGASDNVAVTNDIMTMSLDISMDIGGVSNKITGSFSPVVPDISTGGTTLNVTDSLGKVEANQPAANVVLADEMLLKRKFDVLGLHAEGDKMINGNSSENTNKRPRVSKDAPKVYKNVQSKKKRKISTLNGNEGGNNTGSDGQSSSTCSSEDDNVSQDNNGVANSDSKASQALNSNGKTRASRGSATDPQSLYARKRRERINERLRILQNLVPNGTKVDISTMLEEAVHYVKFLQLQIKLLSSDDLWMYAPIAYNGIDIGLNGKISTLL